MRDWKEEEGIRERDSKEEVIEKGRSCETECNQTPIPFTESKSEQSERRRRSRERRNKKEGRSRVLIFYTERIIREYRGRGREGNSSMV